MKVVPYIRFSHATSSENSEATQLDNLKRYHAYKFPTVPLYDDFEKCTDRVVSAFSKPLRQRPAGKFIDSILNRGDHLLILRMDRAFRRAEDALATLADWQKRGITVHFVDHQIDLSTAAGRMFFSMLAIFAEWESSVKSERIKEAHAMRRQHDLTTCRYSNVLVGFKVRRIKSKELGINTNQIVFDETTLPTLKRYHELMQSGMSLEKMEFMLTKERCEQLGRPMRPLAFCDKDVRVWSETIERGAAVYEFVQPYLASGAHVPYYKCRDYVASKVDKRGLKRKK